MKTDAFFMSEGVSEMGYLGGKKVIQMGSYSQIKEQVYTRAVAKHYGYRIYRKGIMCCPLHRDKTPGMKENVINETTQAPESEAEFSGFTMKFGNTPFLVDCTSARSASRHWMTS